MISVFQELEDGDLKRVMHVQSISHWAPANIGPYSQVVEVGSKVFLEFLGGFLLSNCFTVLQRTLDCTLTIGKINYFSQILFMSSIEGV